MSFPELCGVCAYPSLLCWWLGPGRVTLLRPGCWISLFRGRISLHGTTISLNLKGRLHRGLPPLMFHLHFQRGPGSYYLARPHLLTECSMVSPQCPVGSSRLFSSDFGMQRFGVFGKIRCWHGLLWSRTGFGLWCFRILTMAGPRTPITR